MAMSSTAWQWQIRVLLLVLPTVLSLMACQRAGTNQRADGWERPEPFGAAGAVGGRYATGLADHSPPGEAGPGAGVSDTSRWTERIWKTPGSAP